jgi:hypothetical protein
MSAARMKAVVQIPGKATEGPQLVPPARGAPAPAPVEEIEIESEHPLLPALILGVIALTGAFTFAGSILMWLLVRNTGVGWMFQGNPGG